jgi:ankyrin repeat protein
MICPDVGMTPLHVAAREGYTTIARQLVAAGAAVDIKVARTDKEYRRYQGLTALQLAKEKLTDDEELIRLLGNPSVA